MFVLSLTCVFRNCWASERASELLCVHRNINIVDPRSYLRRTDGTVVYPDGYS